MVKILRNCDPMADCKPVVFMSCFLLIFWLLLSYVTNSYFAIFLMVSNFILIFGCCVSLSGYVVGQLIDTRRETGQLIEVTTISAPQPFVRPPEYPPSYDEAIRFGWQQCMNQNGGDGVVLCIPLENDPRMNPIYMNLPYGTPVETSHLSVPYNGLSSIPSYEMSVSSAANGSTLPLNVSSRSNVINDVIPSIPSYEMSTSSATLGSSLPLNMTSRSNLISDVIPTYELSISPVNNGSTSPSSVISRSSAADNIESSSSIMKPSPTIQNLTPLPDSTVKNSNPENSIAVARANSTSRTFTPHSRLSSESDLNLENASNLDSPKISRFHVLSESPVSSTSSAHASVPELEQFNRSVSEVQNEQDPDVCVNLPTSSQDFTTRRLSYSLSSGHSSSLSRSLSFPGIR